MSMNDLIPAIKKVLEEVDVVLGWTRSPAAGVAVPARFHTPDEADGAIFDSTCIHNLAVHLPRLKNSKVGIVAKGCDARSIVQLIVEGEVSRDRIRVIGVPCPGVIDVKRAWRCYGFGKKIEDAGGRVHMEGRSVPREEILLHKCHQCRDQEPVIVDLAAGDVTSMTPPPPPDKSGIRERFAAMSITERREFWREQFSRCIRCYACREACPLCFCRDVCSMQTREPHWTGGQVNAIESEMAQQVRISHMAGRCTGCEECERACPVGIPLMLLLEEQNKIIEELFAYRAGASLEDKPPLLTYDINRDGGWR